MLLIKRVRVSVIALVPPVRGVRATLSASGLSRVIVAGDEFSPVRLSRSPEAIAFTSPLNVTGLFELEPESGLLLPFEGMGVDTVWQLELPKAANPFDYRTIADVLLTIEYTALNSYDYRHQVLRAQDRSFSGDRAFSVRDQFPDACYEFNNPESVADEASRMRATLPIRREDSPPHLEELAVQELSLFCLRKDGFTPELHINSLGYTAPGGEAITAAEVRYDKWHRGNSLPQPPQWSRMGSSPRPQPRWRMVDPIRQFRARASLVQKWLDPGLGPCREDHRSNPGLALGNTLVKLSPYL
jgi:Tc toxin complex TcA C-terminal TcB-binding domain